MRLREARGSDLEPIWVIETAVFGRDAWTLELLREELLSPHRYYLVAVDDDGVVCGYGGLLVVLDEGDIQTIALDPQARGTGVGRRLMEGLLAEAARRGAHQIFLEVRADNPVARGLYDSLGFVEIGVRPRYYQPDGVDAVMMRLRPRGDVPTPPEITVPSADTTPEREE